MTVDLAFYIIVGCLSGFLSGLLGIGGGLIVVPFLTMVFLNQELPFQLIMHLAVGSSLMVMVLTSQSVVRAYDQRGHIVWPLYRRFVPGIFGGTLLGILLAQHLSTEVLRTVFGIFLVIVSIRMFLLVKPNPDNNLPGTLLHNAISIGSGMLSGLLGLGGGVITIPYLVRHNVSMQTAVGVSSACSLTVAVVGAVACMIMGLNAKGLPAYSTGYVYWPAVICLSIPSMVCTPWGVQLSDHLSVNLLKRIFALVLLTVAIKMI